MGQSTSLDEKVLGVEEAIVNVRLVCEELLNKNVADVKSLNEGKSTPSLIQTLLTPKK